jgi:hypothetical protein
MYYQKIKDLTKNTIPDSPRILLVTNLYISLFIADSSAFIYGSCLTSD